MNEAQSLHQKRTGLMPLVVGASRMIRGKDGKKRSYKAAELRSALAKAKHEGRELKLSCWCFDCKKSYGSLEDLQLDHPSDIEMNEAGQAHVYGYFSEDNAEPNGVQQIDSLSKEITALKAALKSCHDGMAKLDDVEKIMAQRKRAEEIGKMIEDSTKKRETAIENIIGILSDQAAA